MGLRSDYGAAATQAGLPRRTTERVGGEPLARAKYSDARANGFSPRLIWEKDSANAFAGAGATRFILPRIARSEPPYVGACPFNAFTVVSKPAVSATLSICAPLSMRFMKPLNAVPGPSSMNRVKPCASR